MPWLAAVPQLATRYTAAELAQEWAGVPVRGAVAVQAGDSAAEATWLLSSVADASTLAQAQIEVVLQYAPSRNRLPGPWEPLVFSEGRYPKGVRLPLYEHPADWWALRGVEELVGYLEDHGLILELLLRPDQLRSVGEIATKHPRLTIVLCHLGLGEGDPTQEWRADVARLATRKNVAAKVSGLITSRPPEPEDHRRARRAAGWALERWGPERLMFGSDWPVSTRAGRYTDVLEWTMRAVGAASPGEIQSLSESTAVSVYNLAAPGSHQQTISGK